MHRTNGKWREKARPTPDDFRREQKTHRHTENGNESAYQIKPIRIFTAIAIDFIHPLGNYHHMQIKIDVNILPHARALTWFIRSQMKENDNQMCNNEKKMEIG